MSQSERFAIIERLLTGQRSVSFAQIQQRLEVSRATLYRDLRDLKERMGIPIVLDRESGTYHIDPSAKRHPLPSLWFSAAEIHALLTMQRLLDALDSSALLAEHIAPLRQRLLGMLESRQDSADDITRRIRIVSAAARPYTPQHFQTVVTAVMERKRLQLRYTARSSGQHSNREVSPQCLTHYRDNWYLDAWCHSRQALRQFALDAVESAECLDTPAHEIPQAEIDATLGAGYGIFSGPQVQWATLLFSAQRARWVASEHWHPEQQGCYLDDGRYQLRLPYSQDPELLMDILKYGPDCEVIEPAELREKTLELLKAAVGRYGDA